MQKKKVNIKLGGYGKLPEYKTEKSAGADVYAAVAHELVVSPHERVLAPTGLYLGLPDDSEAQVRPRSGLSLKSYVDVKLGTIDADYRGEVGVILENCSEHPFIIKRGDRIAQIVFNGACGLYQADFEIVEELDETERGTGGFGSTGV